MSPMIPVQTPIANIWEPYGLRGNPFFQEELLADTDAPYPVRPLFVGREAELRRIQQMVGGDLSSRIVVEGAPGVGKTSFVNRLKTDLAAGGALTHEEPVRVTRRSTPVTFVADVLRVLVRIRTTLGPLRKRTSDEQFWLDLGRQLEGQSTVGGGVGVAGVSVQYQTGRIPAEAPTHAMFGELREALQRLSQRGKTPVVMHINNLEDLRSGDVASAARLIKEVRDCFLMSGGHWIFVGSSGVDAALFQRYSQVESIFPEKVELGPLSDSEVDELLARRYHYLRRGVRLTPPVEPAVAAALYARYHGDLRHFLRLLSDAAQQLLGLGGTKPMTHDAIVRTMQPRYARALVKRLGETDFNYLRAVVTAAPERPEFRVRDVAAATSLTQSSASELVGRWLRRQVVRQARVEGRSIYYYPTGAASVGCGVPGAPAR